ncbi:OmpA family protein [Cytophagaceae bacterium YF14B1]|uniref:OmpA family protein n=1 Tax=Xanthocytophaga flava TaxID=3048013 RepID=A0AAE3U9S9_9BACT|nr:OmpA family protein [Xanthocytophaga flavus]MDJ1482044.1 OmpA family protein [Xanthocytophaga flavus]
MKRQTLNVNSIVTIALGASLLFSCNTIRNNKRTAIGTGAGVAVGGAVGGILGNKAGNTAGGVIIGAAIGGVAGGAIGRYMDKQAAELNKEVDNAKIERVGEGIKITFNSGILFAFNSDELSDESKKNIQKMADVLKKYKDTNILIDGYTDNVGSDDYNLKLSEKRAKAVSKYLKSLNVDTDRLGTRGFGETEPVASNDTDNGRQQNRRVEVAVFANDDLKKDAKDGSLSLK